MDGRGTRDINLSLDNVAGCSTLAVLVQLGATEQWDKTEGKKRDSKRREEREPGVKGLSRWGRDVLN